VSDGSSIEWTNATWNFLVGCSKVSAGCASCYAIRSVARMSGNPQFGKRYQGLVTVGQKPLNWTGKVAFITEALSKPLHWKQPRRIFVNSLSDLFHPDVPDEWIDQAFAVMAWAQQHTFQVLTKRPERMAAYLTAPGVEDRISSAMCDMCMVTREPALCGFPGDDCGNLGMALPLPNVWLGTSTEDQRAADVRVPHLLSTPAAVRFLSMEPLLGPVRLGQWQPEGVYVDWLRGFDGSDPPIPGLDWVITGGESGPKARPMDPQWARDIRDQCLSAGVAYFHKQNGGRTAKANGRLLDGREWSDFPPPVGVPAS
jgi:protein gp37